jgi:hypothetical protein
MEESNFSSLEMEKEQHTDKRGIIGAGVGNERGLPEVTVGSSECTLQQTLALPEPEGGEGILF